MRFYLLFLLSLLLASCATPSQKFADYAQELDLSIRTIQTPQFEHRLFINQYAKHSSGDELHVYIDGDGTPWAHHRITSDPTSRNPLILELLRQDQAASILLGRPCYHQAKTIDKCPDKYWTTHRYSAEVVNSLVQGLNTWLSTNPYKKIVLIGFSGGGTLAVLMARSVPKLSAIVTVAANLDVEAWSRYHGYRPLNQSLNPAEITLDIQAQQIHLVGNQDKVVPPTTITKFMAKNDRALLIPYPRFEHHCCWAEHWQAIISDALNQIHLETVRE